MRIARCMLGLLAAALATGCEAPFQLEPLVADAPDHLMLREFPSEERFFVVSLSGGGKRASALAQGVLLALGSTPLPQGRTMLDEVDILSATSGGAVPAANFALRGTPSFARFEDRFLRYNFMSRLVFENLEPTAFVGNVLVDNHRIESLVDVFEERVFADATMDRIEQRDGGPYLILNATDIASGHTFAMTQMYFDLICADIGPYPVARAVAASAAFPILLSPITLENQCGEGHSGASPIRAQRRVELAGAIRTPELPSDSPLDPANRAWAQRAQLYLAGDAAYLHLYDGGIADNLGLGEPLNLVSRSFHGNPFFSLAKRAEAAFVIVADARADNDYSYDRSVVAPSMLSVALQVIYGAIDGRSTGLTAQAAQLTAYQKYFNDSQSSFDFSYFAFGNIHDERCAAAFGAIPTDWGLDDDQITALLQIGQAMLFVDSAYRKFAIHAGASPRDLDRLQDQAEDLFARACGCATGDGPCTPDPA